MQASEADHAAVAASRSETAVYSDAGGRFMIIGRAGFDARQCLKMDAYSAALAFVQGKFDIEGDILETIRHFSRQHHSAFRNRIYSGLAHLEHLRTSSLHGLKGPAAKNIQFHYDRSNEFYSQFLDSRMVYSGACFATPEDSLGDAQARKLDLICRDLELRAGDRFLDIGCGWGALVTYAAEHFGVEAFGCTLAEEQLQFAQRAIEERSLSNHVSVKLCDYRDLDGAFDKIASVGMFEHVGLAHYPEFFRKIAALLDKDGVALLHTIGRLDGPCATNPWVAKYIFPGGYMPALSEILPAIERAGLYVTDLEVLRLHYAETIKAWRERFAARRDEVKASHGERFCRMWEFYLAGSETAFRCGGLGVFQIQLAKRLDAVPLTRDYIARTESFLRERDSAAAQLRLAGE